MNGLRNGDGVIFKAYASRYILEESGKMRTGIEFHAIPKSTVDAFLEKESISLVQHIEDSVEFHHRKLEALGDGEQVYIIQVWFDCKPEALEIDLTEYYTIEKGDVYDCTIALFLNEENELKEKCVIKVCKDDERELLKALTSIRSHEGNQLEEENNVNAIGQYTLFFGTNFFYVGAALCAGIYSASKYILDIYLADKLVAFFDFGYRSVTSSRSVYVNNNTYKAQANLQIIQNEIQTNPDKTVIISHWHSDHINLVGKVPPATYQNFWAQSTWYTPQSSSPVALYVNRTLVHYGGRLTMINNQYPASNRVYRINNNQNLTFGKADAFPLTTRAGKHPHHHGLYAKVKLADFDGRNLVSVLLAGDTTYSGIPPAFRNNNEYLQACHHCGNYAYPPSPRDDRASIPTPKIDSTYQKVVYSANGYTHRHPNAVIARQHFDRNWTTCYRTDTAGTGRVWVINSSVLTN